MGKDFDAVVVDCNATAIACIAFVKEHRVPPVTFLPLATIKVCGRACVCVCCGRAGAGGLWCLGVGVGVGRAMAIMLL